MIRSISTRRSPFVIVAIDALALVVPSLRLIALWRQRTALQMAVFAAAAAREDPRMRNIHLDVATAT